MSYYPQEYQHKMITPASWPTKTTAIGVEYLTPMRERPTLPRPPQPVRTFRQPLKAPPRPSAPQNQPFTFSPDAYVYRVLDLPELWQVGKQQRRAAEWACDVHARWEKAAGRTPSWPSVTWMAPLSLSEIETYTKNGTPFGVQLVTNPTFFAGCVEPERPNVVCLSVSVTDPLSLVELCAHELRHTVQLRAAGYPANAGPSERDLMEEGARAYASEMALYAQNYPEQWR